MICEAEWRSGIILWKVGEIGQLIEDTVNGSISGKRNADCIYYTGGSKPQTLDQDKHYLLFYVFSNKEDEINARNYAKDKKIKISFAALCGSFEEGIDSMRKGDCYALRLPLEPEKVIRCYQYFMQLQKKECNL